MASSSTEYAEMEPLKRRSSISPRSSLSIEDYRDRFESYDLHNRCAWRRRTTAFTTHLLVVLPFAIFTICLFIHHSVHKRAIEEADALNVDLFPVVKTNPHPISNAEADRLDKAIVAVSIARDDTSWLTTHFPNWTLTRYTMDVPQAGLPHQVPRNHGGESMGYLTYIIDNYDSLPDFTLFLHAGRYQWHNEDPLYDAVPVLRSLQLHHVSAVGYVNLRCTWRVGCPGEVRPNVHSLGRDAMAAFLALVPAWLDLRARMELHYGDAFAALFPGQPVPRVVGIPCCNQFALARWKILERPRSDYVRYRQWLLDNEMDDSISGRVMEYIWHIMMGMPPVYCEDAGDCFCKKFGLCNLTCTFDRCENRYQMPPNGMLPLNWPAEGPGLDGLPELDWYLKDRGNRTDEDLT